MRGSITNPSSANPGCPSRNNGVMHLFQEKLPIKKCENFLWGTGFIFREFEDVK